MLSTTCAGSQLISKIYKKHSYTENLNNERKAELREAEGGVVTVGLSLQVTEHSDM